MANKEIRFDTVYSVCNEEAGLDPDCFLCTSHSKNATGYIQFKKDGFSKMHRWIWWRSTGEKPEVVVHLCGNRACINIKHMKGCTEAEAKLFKLSDKIIGCDGPPMGNLNALGNRGGAAHRRFSVAQIREIRRLRSAGMRPKSIGELFSCHATTISRICMGDTYEDTV